jgi:hypothetical protein
MIDAIAPRCGYPQEEKRGIVRDSLRRTQLKLSYLDIVKNPPLGTSPPDYVKIKSRILCMTEKLDELTD